MKVDKFCSVFQSAFFLNTYLFNYLHLAHTFPCCPLYYQNRPTTHQLRTPIHIHVPGLIQLCAIINMLVSGRCINTLFFDYYNHLHLQLNYSVFVIQDPHKQLFQEFQGLFCALRHLCNTAGKTCTQLKGIAFVK